MGGLGMSTLVLLRHGESVWNKENRFTGWTDVDLTAAGIAEARQAGVLLQTSGLDVNIAFTSLLKRAIHTLWLTLESMDRLWIPVYKSWRLNERHYGALQGLNKAETTAKFGEEQVQIWRRSYDIQPPALEPSDPRYPGHDPRYRDLRPSELPCTESLKDTIDRVMPYWLQTIAPAVQSGQTVLVAAHGNTIRGIIKHLDHLGDAEVVGVEIPTGVPLVYTLNDDLKPIDKNYLK